MKELIFATHNAHKAEEINQLIRNFDVKSLDDIDYIEDIEETGTTLQENALIKAHTVYEATGKACFADDTGLEVNALRGAPGVFSARYAGEDASFNDNMNKLLAALKGMKNRKAQFRTVIAYIDEDGKHHFFEGVVEGSILEDKRGEGGFGYDPIFQPTSYSQSFAQMSAREKNRISHRGRAVQKFVKFLEQK